MGLARRSFVALVFYALLAPALSAQTAVAAQPIRIGVSTGTSPLVHADRKGKPSGFIVDLVAAICKERNLSYVIDYRPWNDLITDFKAGRVDVMANMVYTAERTTYADFSIAHLMLPGAIYIHKGDSTVRKAEDLATKRIAAALNTYAYETTAKHGWSNSLVPVQSLNEALAQLNSGQVDAVFGIRAFADYFIRENHFDHVEMAPFNLPDLRYQYHLAVPKAHDQLLYEINTGLVIIRRNGTYDDIYERWFGLLEPRKLRWSDLRPYRLQTLIIIFTLAAAFWLQRRLVKKLRLQAKALQTSEERLSLLLEGSQDAFWDWNIITNRVTRSERWSKMLGGTPDQIGTGVDALDPVIHPDDITLARNARSRLLQLGHERVEYRVRARNGQWIWILDRGMVVARDEKGLPTRVTGAASDITVHKRIEEALGRSQALLEQSQRAAEIGGWEYDTANDSLFWTFQSFLIHDLEPDEKTLTMERVFLFYQPTEQNKIRQAFKLALEKGQPFELELDLITAKQRHIWVRTIGRTDKNTERVVRVYGSFQDITQRINEEEDRRQLQLKMLEAQKLESLGVLAGGIAHDFNNLLTVIIGNASLAREAPALAAESLTQIETASQRAADLCRQMLTYAGKSRISMEDCDINDIVANTVHLLRLSINKNASLDFALGDQPLVIEADPTQIRQVVMNLVINASEAIGDGGGRIRVSTTRRPIAAETLLTARVGQKLEPGEYVVLEVQDEGSGMSEETMLRIFDPFFTTKFVGRGLGLAAVLGIVRSHRGAFFVESTLGKGATFRMLLPLSDKPLPLKNVQPAARPTEIAALRTAASFLVVDDEPNVRKLACSILERQGHNVAQASDGYEALALLLAHGDRFAAILLDLTMTGMDGRATLHELRQMKLDVPVLIMSGYSEVDVRERFPNDPRLSFLPKPFTPEELLKRLHELLARPALRISLPHA